MARDFDDEQMDLDVKETERNLVDLYNRLGEYFNGVPPRKFLEVNTRLDLTKGFIVNRLKNNLLNPPKAVLKKNFRKDKTWNITTFKFSNCPIFCSFSTTFCRITRIAYLKNSVYR